MLKQKKLIILTSITVGVLVVLFGLSYALFIYERSSVNQELVLGDIWMKYTEVNGLNLEGAFPGDSYSKYFEFTITGKNTYTEKDISYDIRITKGDVPEGKTEDNRIEDKYLKFKLVEVNGNAEIEMFTDRTYDDLSNETIHVSTIPKSTNSYLKTYRLYMVISEDLKVGNTEGAISVSEFENLFGSIKIATTGDFVEKSIAAPASQVFKNYLINSRPDSYALEDGIYYISGEKDDNNSNTTDDVDFNYVWYSGKLWRITALNPDGTMKMITEDLITTIAYGENNIFYTNENTNSWVYQWLNQDFLDTLYNHENIIVQNAKWNATATSSKSDKPDETTMVTSPVGLLNSYEYYISGLGTENYLDIGSFWWLLNPSDGPEELWHVDLTGYIEPKFLSSEYDGVRPSINLKSTVQFASGTGTKNDPYKLKGDQEAITPNVTLLNTRQSGEYVEIENDKDTTRRFRIVGTEVINGNLTTKLVLDDFVKIKSTGENLQKMFSNDYTYGGGTSLDYWDYFLNTHWITSLDTSKLEKGTYYLGAPDSSSENYKLAICASPNNTVSTKTCTKTSTTYSGYVGLLRYGEMFSSIPQGLNLSSKSMWLITPYSTLVGMVVTYVSETGLLKSIRPTESSDFSRPSINLKSDIVIKSGNGTKESPYQIAIETYLIADGTNFVLSNEPQ